MYIRATLKHSLGSFCGDPPELLKLIVYCGADFAGDTRASKSTSGCYIALVGPNAFMPLSSLCKKQTVVSHSSTESEIIAMEVALCSEVIHILPETNKCAHDTNEQMPRTMQSTYLDAHTRTSHPFGKRQACSHSQRQSSTQANHRSRPGTAVPLRTTEITYPPEAETVCNSLKQSQDPGPPPIQ